MRQSIQVKCPANALHGNIEFTLWDGLSAATSALQAAQLNQRQCCLAALEHARAMLTLRVAAEPEHLVGLNIAPTRVNHFIHGMLPAWTLR